MTEEIQNIRPDDLYRGYIRKPDFPFKVGDKVCFFKGARLLSMHPKRKSWYAAKRAQEVEIDHFLPGCSIGIADVYVKEDGTGRVYQTVRLKDVANFAKRHGFPNAWQDEEGTFKFLLQFCTREHVTGRTYRMVLPLTNPSVRWAGRGGYWVECDVNDIVGIREGP